MKKNIYQTFLESRNSNLRSYLRHHCCFVLILLFGIIFTNNVIAQTNSCPPTPFAPKFYEQVTDITTSENFNGGGVAYGNGKFVAVVNHDYDSPKGYIFTSTDGINWTKQTPAITAIPQNFSGFFNVIYANGQFFAVGGDYLLNRYLQTSPDGITWTNRTLPTTSTSYSIVYDVAYDGNNTLVAVDNYSRIIKSTDNGVTWVAVPQNLTSVVSSTIAYGNGTWVVGGLGNSIIASTDLADWTRWDLYEFSYEGLYVTFGEGKFVAVRSDGKAFTSVNGINWTPQNTGSTDFLSGISFHNGEFIASDPYSENSGDILTSPNGICWASQPSGFEFGFEKIAYNNGTYVAVGADGKIYSTVCHTPVAFTLSSPNNCAESLGASISLSNSERNYMYRLNRNGIPVGTPLAGSGSAITFMGITAPGNYTITASSLTGGCSAIMDGTINVVSGEVPNIGSIVRACSGNPSTITATSPSNKPVDWYTAGTNGTLLGSSASGTPFSVSPTSTTTYYAQVQGVNFGTQSFNFTGGMQTFTVPAGVTKITVIAKGAAASAGYYGDAGTEGKGGMVTTDLQVTPGQVLNIFVGGLPTGSTNEIGGYNGGGSTESYTYGGGGGATDIRIGGTALTNRVVVAGGGGAAGYDGTRGGNGGGLIGQTGDSDTTYPNTVKGGGGGTQTAGGAGGAGVTDNGNPGTLGQGGSSPYYAAAGGGGYYGGGSGGENSDYVGGGGGGSSYTDPTLCSNVVHTQGEHSGSGTLTLSWGDGCISTQPIAVTVVPLAIIPSVIITANTGSSIVAGTSVTFTAAPTNGGPAPTYIWKTNGVTIPNETGISYTSSALINGDKITVEMTSNIDCALFTTAISNIVTIGTYAISPSPSFTGLNTSYCDLDNSSILTGNLPASDAFFSGPGITNNSNGTATFSPLDANSGLNTIQYLSTAAQGPAWKQIEGGYYHSIGLKEDGTLWAWGSNEYGQLGNGSSVNSDIPIQIGTASDWDYISAGIYHNFAIKKDGTLWTWGYNGFGVMGIGMDSDIPVQVGTDNDWATISTNNGAYFCIAIKKNGTLWAWGNNGQNRLGISGGNRSTPTQIGVETNWAKVSVGDRHVIALKKDATLWSWGNNTDGQLGNGNTNQINFPTQVGTDNNWHTIRSGFNQSFAIKIDGSLWAWGKNTSGELGIGNNSNSPIPVQVGTETNWVSIWSSQSTHALKSDGTLWVWGNNEYGQLGNGTNTNINTPEQIENSTDWSVLGGGPYHSFAMKANGSLFGTGDNSEGVLGIGSKGSKNTFTKAVVQVSPVATTTVNACPDFTGLQTAYCKDDQAITLTGNYAPLGTFSGPGITDNGNGTATFNPTQAANGGTITYAYSPSAWTTVSAGEANTMSIKSNGSLWGWGENSYNELGNGTDEQTNSPLQSDIEKNWKNISQGFYHSLGIKKDGTLWGWGYNSYGELGTADTYSENPIQIGAATNWKYVVAGYYTSLGIKEDGTLWTWGYNGYGKLGNGTTSDSDTPTQIGIDNNWATISSDSYGNHVLATKTNGTIWAWGYNEFGQLGDGTTTNSSVPKQISTSTDWATVAAGSYHSVAIKTDGTLWTWGGNWYGELGNGTTNNIAAPVKIGTDKNWKTIAASYYFSLATKTDSTLWGWGYNEYGQLGNGTNTNTLQPVRAGSAANWANVEAGGYHSIGLTVDGNLYGWGYNGNGELGNGTNNDTNTPTIIGSLVTSSVTTKSVIVNFTAPPTVIAPVQKIVCFPTTLSLTASGCAGTIKWSDNTTGTSLTLTTAGTYVISATCTENGCTSTASDSVDLIIDYAEIPLLTATNMSICKGEATVLAGTCSSLTDTFRWSVKEFNTPNLQYPNTNRRSVSEPGVYKGYCETIYGCLSAEVSIEITQGNDCEDLSFLTITPDKAAICPGQSVILTANGCTGSVTWLSAGSTHSGTSISFTPTKTSNITAFCSTGSSASVEVVVAQTNVVVNKNTSTERVIIRAIDTLESDKKVGTVNFTPSANVIYEAGKSITLKPGFIAEKHSVFKAEIKTCN